MFHGFHVQLGFLHRVDQRISISDTGQFKSLPILSDNDVTASLDSEKGRSK